MTTVVFVDDELQLLEGLRDTLHGLRTDWEMRFVAGADAALALLDSEPVDVLVADVAIAGADGAELLGDVQRRHRDVVRVVLSGALDSPAALRLSGVAHLFLGKPVQDGGHQRHGASRE